MIRLLRLLVLLPLGTLALAAAQPAPALLAGQRVLMLGDSITQDGRYVTFLEYYLHRLAPGAKCDLIAVGLGSETLSGITEPGHPYPRPNVQDRLERALATVKPTVVFACYGMNDGIYHPPSPERLATFTAGLDQLIARVRATGAKLVLLTPPLFDPLPIPQRIAKPDATAFGFEKTPAAYNDVLAEFAGVVRARAAADLTVIDLNAGMLAALAEQRRTNPAFTFSPDGVHPNELGHLLLGRLVAQGLGLSLPAAPLADELARIQADPLFPLVRDRRALRSEAWLAFIGYTRNGTFRAESKSAAEKVVGRLQLEIERQLAAPATP